ncbi:MAG TPA: DUF4397 domain-containing protein [Gemmatimonadaceae bacterium]|nr:DUF4397 domain-containing protein [Gemmatimonadaceae bacterium]
MQIRFAGTLLLCALAVAACSDDDSDTVIGPPPTTGADSAQIRFVNAAATADSVDVMVDTTVVASSVFFPDSAACVKVPTGSHSVTILSTGTTDTLATFTPSLTANQSSTVVLTGDANGFTPQIFPDTLTPADSGRARLRVINAAPSLAAADVFVTLPGDTLPATPTQANLTFGTASPFLDVPSGDTEVRFTDAGTLNARLDVNPTPAFTLDEQGSQTLIAVEAPGGGEPLGFFNLGGCQ